MPPSYAILAEFYRIRLQAGLVTEDQIRDWAMNVIKMVADPPAEIIEVSWSRTLGAFEANLKSVPGERDNVQAGLWLLGLLREQYFGPDADLTWCASKAMHISRAAGLSDNVYYEFDGLADDVFLAKNNPDGDLLTCRRLMREALAKYPSPPKQGEALYLPDDRS